MKKLIALIAALTCGVAVAQVGNSGNTGFSVGSASASDSRAASVAGAGASSSVDSRNANSNTNANSNGLVQGQDASNQNSVTINGSEIPTRTTLRTVPAVVGPVMNPTTPCTAVITAGASVIGFGGFIGGTVEDKECTRREFARVLSALGQLDAALSVLCANEMVWKAAPALCKKVQVALGSTDTVASSTTPAPSPSTQAVAVTPSTAPAKQGGPNVGQVEKGSDGKSYRYNGQGWVPITTMDDVQRTVDRLTTSALHQ